MKPRHLSSLVDVGLSILPIVVMAVLAAWSYWLVRTTPGAGAAQTSTQVSSLPDMSLSVFQVETYDESGRLISRVQGERGVHHPSDDSMDIDGAHIWSQRLRDGQWREVRAQSQQLWANGAQTQFRLTGQAQIVQLPTQANGETTSIHGDELFIDNEAKVYSSASPVEMKRGQQVLRGDRMQYDQDQGVLEMQGRVSAWRPASQGS